MAQRLNAKLEKRERNKLFALKFQKKDSKKRRKSPFAEWCRVPGHPASCNCLYPSKEELKALQRK